MVGGLLAAARGPFAQTPRTVAAIAAVLLCGPPIVLATAFEPLSTSGTRDGLLYAGSDLLLAVVGLLFVALCVGLGYQMRDRELSRRHRVESARRESRRAHERYVSLTAQRFALMELYVARGMTAHAEGARMDALLTLQILQRAPQFDKQILGNEYDLPLPFWLRDAHDELRREQGRSNPKDARTASEAYRAMVAAAED
jgi:hypothetical protein